MLLHTVQQTRIIQLINRVDRCDTNSDTTRYDTIEGFNMDWKAECGQLNLAPRSQKQKRYKKETKTNKTPVPP